MGRSDIAITHCLNMIDRVAPHLSNPGAHHLARAFTGRARELCMIASGPTFARTPAGIFSLRGWVAKLMTRPLRLRTILDRKQQAESRLTSPVNAPVSSSCAVLTVARCPSPDALIHEDEEVVSPAGEMGNSLMSANVRSDGFLDTSRSSPRAATSVCNSQTLAASPSAPLDAPIG